MFKKKGQSTLEYVLILTAIIAAIVVLANTVMKEKVQSSADHLTSEMKAAADQVDFDK